MGRPTFRRPKLASQPSPATVKSFVDFVQTLPDELDERPAKRTKRLEADAPVTVARHTFTFAGQASSSEPGLHISRSDVGEHLRIRKHFAESTFVLEISPAQTKYKKIFSKIELPLELDASSTPDLDGISLTTLLGLPWEQTSDPGTHAAVWVAIDLTIIQDGSDVRILVRRKVQWNASSGMRKPITLPQKDMRGNVMRTCFPGPDVLPAKPKRHERDLSVDKPSIPTIQDFYDAVCVPERDMPDLDLPSGQISGLSAQLYPFQRRSVQWLLNREGVKWTRARDMAHEIQTVLEPYRPDTSELPISFRYAQDAFGNDLAVSPLFGMITTNPTLFHQYQNVKGGILAEEMGLGKTLEMISLILLNRRPEEPAQVYDPYLGRQVRPAKGTLIVTPPSLRDQWLSELAKHAPGLKVMHYAGLRQKSKFYEESVAQALVEQLAQHDVVVTTYDILRSEIHVALDPPARSMRTAKVYTRVTCPLVQLSWWRVCIDEAQMVENWRSDTALMARIIPRVNAWAVTGTPVKDSVQEDLRGLLAFLRFEPYASDNDVWKAFSSEGIYKPVFRQVFNLLCLRHNKGQVRKEIELPSQKRYVITMPFSAVEEQHYQSMFQSLIEPIGLDKTGSPVVQDWNPNSPGVQQAMRLALDRLRQIVLHPEIGPRGNQVLGHRTRDRPLRTVAEVLDAMMEQSESSMRSDQRALYSLKLQKGQVLAMLGKTQDALEVWEEVKRDATAEVADSKDYLRKEIEAARKDKESRCHGAGSEGDDHEDGPFSPTVSDARRRLRHILEVQHKAVFFCANAYYSLKSDETITTPDSEEFKRLEKLETDGYEFAKRIRKEILQETQHKAKQLMDMLAAGAEEQDFAVIPEMQPMQQHGIETRSIVEASQTLCDILDEQAGILDDWREHMIQLLLKNLMDEESEEVTGEEFEESTKVSDEISVYVQALKTVLADRHQYLSGQANELIDVEYKGAMRLAKSGEGPCPEKVLELFALRDELKLASQPAVSEELSSVRAIISALRALSTKLGLKASNSDMNRSANELAIVTNLLKLAQKQFSQQSKAIAQMEQEVTLFTDTMNARIDFYRQLQAVSDMVADYAGTASVETLQTLRTQEEAAQKALSTAEAKHRYLVHLKQAESSSEEQRMCTICQETFSLGVLTICGHQFCKECLMMWFNAHRTCPVCKRKLTRDNLHDITLKPQELKLHSENTPTPSKHNSTTKKTGIYSELNPEKLAEIKNIDLDGPNFTTKVDTLVRHIVWLREFDPGAKSIVFSQYAEFLHVLRQAFTRHRIGFASFTDKDGIRKFKEDPGVEVFLLHARAHSSGLNLVNASHVFLCEPILNTALELQAIARVDRIGQEHETTVWLYLVEGTVEESIYNLSVQRRMEHMGRHFKGKSTRSTPELLDANLEVANSMELQEASLGKLMGKGSIAGEVVDGGDLWTCLFGHVRADGEREERLRNNPVVRGQLAAQAAEGRIVSEEI